MKTHRTEENNDAHYMWVLTWVGINSDNDMEEEESRENKVDIHQEVAGMVLHERTKEIGEVENEERAIKECQGCNGIVEND
jgi:hypothetical protein